MFDFVDMLYEYQEQMNVEAVPIGRENKQIWSRKLNLSMHTAW